MLCRISIVLLAVLGWTSLSMGQGRDTTTGIGSSQTSGGTSLGNSTNRFSTTSQSGGGQLNQSPAEMAGLGDRATALSVGGGFLGQTQGVQSGFLGGGGTTGNNAATLGGRGGAAGGGQFGNFGGAAGRGGQQAGRGGFGQQGQQQTRLIRTRIRVPADYTTFVVPTPVIRSKLVTQFDRLGTLESESRVKEGTSRAFWNSNITVITSGQTVTLRGRVSTERDRQIAEKMAKFEPGVVQVVNELSVDSL